MIFWTPATRWRPFAKSWKRPNHAALGCVLLSKRKQRAREVVADYIGFEIDDEFVVGYGLDFMERYRNLPYLGVLKKELIDQSNQ
jgi:hypoxanthine phosphoribosyltransferase